MFLETSEGFSEKCVLDWKDEGVHTVSTVVGKTKSWSSFLQNPLYETWHSFSVWLLSVYDIAVKKLWTIIFLTLQFSFLRHLLCKAVSIYSTSIELMAAWTRPLHQLDSFLFQPFWYGSPLPAPTFSGIAFLLMAQFGLTSAAFGLTTQKTNSWLWEEDKHSTSGLQRSPKGNYIGIVELHTCDRRLISLIQNLNDENDWSLNGA